MNESGDADPELPPPFGRGGRFLNRLTGCVEKDAGGGVSTDGSIPLEFDNDGAPFWLTETLLPVGVSTH